MNNRELESLKSLESSGRSLGVTLGAIFERMEPVLNQYKEKNPDITISKDDHDKENYRVIIDYCYLAEFSNNFKRIYDWTDFFDNINGYIQAVCMDTGMEVRFREVENGKSELIISKNKFRSFVESLEKENLEASKAEEKIRKQKEDELRKEVLRRREIAQRQRLIQQKQREQWEQEQQKRAERHIFGEQDRQTLYKLKQPQPNEVELSYFPHWQRRLSNIISTYCDGRRPNINSMSNGNHVHITFELHSSESAEDVKKITKHIESVQRSMAISVDVAEGEEKNDTLQIHVRTPKEHMGPFLVGFCNNQTPLNFSEPSRDSSLGGYSLLL